MDKEKKTKKLDKDTIYVIVLCVLIVAMLLSSVWMAKETNELFNDINQTNMTVETDENYVNETSYTVHEYLSMDDIELYEELGVIRN